MLGWILGFLLGAYITEFVAAVAAKFILYIFAVILFGRWTASYRSRSGLVFLTMIFGLIWGSIHNWRAPQKIVLTKEEGIVLRGNDNQRFGRHLIIWRPSSTSLMQVKGSARFGDRGRIHCRLAQEESICRFTKVLSVRYQKVNQWLAQSQRLQRNLEQRALALGEPWSAWTLALFLGDWSRLSSESKQWFRQAGIMHLLVLSGLHISLIFFLIEKFFFTLLIPFYLGRLLRADYWVSLASLSFFLTLIVGLLYLLTVGFHHPSLRAFFVFISFQLGRWAFGGRKPMYWISIALFAQTLVAPMGFWERSNLLSWFAYLWLISRLWDLSQEESSIKAKWKGLVFCQLGMTALSTVLIGELSSISILANLLIGPIFPLIFVVSLLWITLPSYEYVAHLCAWVLDCFFSLVSLFAHSSKILILPVAFSQTLTMILSSALLCYMFGCYAQHGRQLKTRETSDNDK